MNRSFERVVLVEACKCNSSSTPSATPNWKLELLNLVYAAIADLYCQSFCSTGRTDWQASLSVDEERISPKA